MGNGLSCCQFKPGSGHGGGGGSGRDGSVTFSGNGKWPNYYQPDSGSNNNNSGSPRVEHINDREPVEDATDPSINPTVQPIFVKGLRRRPTNPAAMTSSAAGASAILGRASLRTCSSCSHIIVPEGDSTVWQPQLKPAVRGLALAVYYHVQQQQQQQQHRVFEAAAIFDELVHPLQRGAEAAEAATRRPDHRTVYRFVRTLFCSAQLTAECAIISLVYLERLMAAAEIELQPNTWRRCLLGAILLASKVWDDQAVWNVDYCQILKDARVEDMNELERKYLELIQFNINVPASVYARYYFDIRAMLSNHEAGANSLSASAPSPVPLSREGADRLELIGPTGQRPVAQASLSTSSGRAQKRSGGKRLKRGNSLGDEARAPVRFVLS
ncbi:hypothetical protein BOX15_Mlig004565g1 [Macrostomum lignano]|uniref:Cyclin-like domain-containing protein n=1 Tax=Macrostomum lignano TaxID=282301 RepID=A0A267EXI3_9PLAT|nr:hypothetical protein BOX15_Mlig004565g1 [Macrostomum lignano]